MTENQNNAAENLPANDPVNQTDQTEMPSDKDVIPAEPVSNDVSQEGLSETSDSVESKADPFADREAEKYDNPIPSREMLLEILEQEQKPLRLNQIAKLLKISDDERFEALSRRLKAMLRDGQLLRNRRGAFGVIHKMDLIKGKVQGHPGGFGFLIPEDGSDDLFLSDREMHKVFHGDIIIASVVGVDRKGRREGLVVEVVEHHNETVLGRLHLEEGFAWVQPNNNRIAQDIFIPKDGVLDATEGQMVVAEILHRPSSRASAVGKVVEVLGDYLSPGMEIESAIHTHEIPNEWSDDLLAELNAISDEVTEADKEGRKDLRGLNLVTIDGEDSKDFDDAVYAKRRKKGWRLVVAIADVSHYVKPGTALDKEAHKRGNSVYFPQQVIPMLPEKLSNGLCSLNPQVDRLCMVADMSIDEEGKLERSQFYDAVMNSKARMTYNQVHDILQNPDSENRETFKEVVEDVETLNELYQVLKKAREERGALEFETTETRIVFDDDRKIDKIIPVVRNDAHKLIEECMLMANVSTARYLKWHKIPMVYRIHETPKEEKLANLKTFLGDFGIELGGGDEPTATDFAEVYGKVKGQPYEHLVGTVMLRSMNQAVYSPEKLGHFGLNYDHYTHFTSPIRRYPDLLIHRAIRFAWNKQDTSEFTYTEQAMATLGEHCSSTERRADDATREAVTFLKCEFLSHRLGEEYEAVVTAATNFGLFVELDPLYVEGLVHITELGEDYFHYDNSRHCLKGERTGKTYRLGDRVKVQVAQVNLDDRKIDLRFIKDDAAEQEGVQAQENTGVEGENGVETSEEDSKPRRKKRNFRKHRRNRNRSRDNNSESE